MPNTQHQLKTLRALPANSFQPRWAGLATAQLPYPMKNSPSRPFSQLVQRSGEIPEQFQFKAFLSTRSRNEVDALTTDFPKRWHVEEFFNAHQALGWNRAGTLNLHIRYGQMSAALIAQALLHQFRQRIGPPFSDWDAKHLASSIFRGIDGDIRVQQDTLLVTFYNAPNVESLRQHYQDLPRILAQENIDPRIPWLFNFKLDFRFK